MWKIFLATALTVAALAEGGARAQTAEQKHKILNSGYMPRAGACKNDLEAAGKKAGLEVFKGGPNHVLVIDHTPEKLRPIQGSLYDCLDAVFPKNDVFTGPKGAPAPARAGTKSRIWYVLIEGYYISCSSNGYASRSQIERLGGVGPQSKDFGVQIACNLDAGKILGMYTPPS